MEPMTLGSPVGSPSSPSGSAYLPAFLMGEPTLQHPSSPTKTPRQVTIGAVSVTPRSLNLSNISPATERRTRAVHVTQVEKPGGPPTRGLFDTLESVTVPNASVSASPACNPNTSMLNQSCLPPVTPMRNSDDLCAMDNWVTVFGFPPAAASMILNQFSQLGQLLERKFPPKGNWVHLHYYSKMEACRALTYHGKVFGGTTMIAVIPCRDPNVIKDDKGLHTPGSAALPNRMAATPGSNINSPWTPNSSMIHSPRARPLSRSCHPDNEVLSQHNTAIRNTGIMSRAIDYVFGW